MGQRDRVEPDLVYSAVPGSAAEDALRLLDSWSATVEQVGGV
ncbi:hypothetical protein [Arthrobacter sp. ov118]|nr:hypothetical protein [Arthrobacter sp. ov118]